MEYGFGDESVNSDTALIAGLKWAYDYISSFDTMNKKERKMNRTYPV